MKAPIARQQAVHTNLHGIRLRDDYAWLRADNWQECVLDPAKLPDAICEHLQAENAWHDHVMAPTRSLQATLLAEMRGRIVIDDESLPDLDGPWCYLERISGNQEYPVHLRRPRGGGAESVLIDFNHEAREGDYFEPGDVEHSPDHGHLAWSVDTNGSEHYQLNIRNIESGVDLQQIENIYELCWGNAQVIFYTRLDEQLRANRVYRHTLGDASENDVLVYEELDTRFSCSVWTSRSGEYVFISADTDDQSEVWFIPTRQIDKLPSIIEPRREGVEYSVEHQAQRFIILTNADAEDFRIVETDVGSPGRSSWCDLVPHCRGRMILDVSACEHWLLWMERENALPRVCYCAADGVRRVLDFDGAAYALSLEPLFEYDSQACRVGYESPAMPEHIYEIDLSSGHRVLVKQQQIPSGHDPENYCVQRIQADTEDGFQIPITLMYHRNTAVDGSAPCLLYGYGAYGDSVAATFASDYLSLIDRGFVYAIAHVRGGQEKGRAWYEAAKLADKQNSFDDFIAAARQLIESAYTRQGGIIIHGASAGGLLIAAVLNQAPELWGAAVADVPFVDVVNTMVDETLPLTPGEWSQWGNPLQSREILQAMLKYSPYENVADQSYPPIRVTAGISDSRVTYWEAAKWVAKHRAIRSDSGLIVLKIHMQAGHFGETGRFASLADYAEEQAFMLMVMNIKADFD